MSIPVNPLLIIGTSLAYIVGQAWNKAIQGGIDYHYPPGSKQETLKARILYALIITIIISLFALGLNYLNQKAINEETAAKQWEATRVAAKTYR